MILMKVLLADGFMDADKNDKLTVRMRVGAYCTNKDTEVLEIPHSKLKNYASMLRGKTFVVKNGALEKDLLEVAKIDVHFVDLQDLYMKKSLKVELQRRCLAFNSKTLHKPKMEF
jgi:hypothetical protein